jgi:cytoskeletal protein CcmA (bactofilin family)
MRPTAFDRDENGALREKKPSATVRGAAELSGGDYTKILILGSGVVTGDVRAERLRSFGSGELQGVSEFGRLSVVGSGSFGAGLTAGRVRALGALDVRGRLEARKLTATGACEVGGDVLVDEIRTLGLLECQSAETSSFRVRGAVQIDGLLSGDLVELHLGGLDSRVKEIGGERVEVWRHSFGKRNPLVKGLGWLCNPGLRAYLRASTVEADDVALENTRAEVVRGKRVWIGAGCEIDEVEYEESLTVHPKAVVGKRTKQ